ncbi:MAG: hypothetical protein RL367_2330 [Pseudomonadota bacterium]|jgi:acyl-coenzyme A thioesterase PaaI-like protein
MTKEHLSPPCYFKRSQGGFEPTRLARNPWFDNAIAGGPTAALFGLVIEQAGFDPQFAIARITIDILGRVPSALLFATVTPVRQGRQMQLHRIDLVHDGRVVAQAHVLLCRDLTTPAFPAPFDYPLPETLDDSLVLVGATMAGAIRTRPIMGSVRDPGRGVIWLAMDGEVVQGESVSPFLKACLFADFGNGVGCSTRAQEWSFANLDINIQFLRMPVGDWILLDAQTIGGGNGHAVAENVLADRDGVFAKGTQTIFVAPGSAGIKLRVAGDSGVG